MLKTLTFSLSLALALGLCSSASKAGGLFHGHGDDCLASPQGPVVSPQAPCASPQGECVNECFKPKCDLLAKCKGLGNKMGCCLHDKFNGLCCGFNNMGCGFKDLCCKLKPKPPCYTYEWVLKKKRVWGCHKSNPCGQPACETCMASPQGGPMPAPQAYGAPQASYAPVAAGQIGMATGGIVAPAASPIGDEAPPAPEVKAPPAPRTSGLLFSTPTGN
jgi:hypothetical protein